MITNTEKSQIKAMLQSPQWRTIEQIATTLCEKIHDESSSKDTEWETLRSILRKEGEVSGIRRFIQELYSLAQQE